LFSVTGASGLNVFKRRKSLL